MSTKSEMSRPVLNLVLTPNQLIDVLQFWKKNGGQGFVMLAQPRFSDETIRFAMFNKGEAEALVKLLLSFGDRTDL